MGRKSYQPAKAILKSRDMPPVRLQPTVGPNGRVPFHSLGSQPVDGNWTSISMMSFKPEPLRIRRTGSRLFPRRLTMGSRREGESRVRRE